MAADRKTTDHTAITAAQVDAANDIIEVVDVSDTTDAASGTNKKMTGVEVKKLTSVPQWVSGATNNRRIVPSPTNANASTLVLTINLARGFAFRLEREITIDKLGFEITTGTTGKMWVGIYSADSTGLPSALVAWSTERTITTPAVYEGLNAATVTIQPGLYWCIYNTNTANTARAFSVVSAGFFTITGFPSTVGTVWGNGYEATQTYVATAPSTYPAGGGFMNGNANLPLIFFRIT